MALAIVAPIPNRLGRVKPPLERYEQQSLCAWLRFKRIQFFAVPNGARVRPTQAKRLKAEGMTAGAPDIVLCVLSKDGKPIAIEMKRQMGGRVSPDQAALHSAMRLAGWIVIVAKGAQDAIKQLLELI